MTMLLPRFCFLLAAITLAAAGGLVHGETALAQQPRNPTELWEQYPLDSEQERSPSENEAPSSRDTSERAPAVGNDSEGATTDGELFPLLPIVVALSVIFLGVSIGAGVLARNRQAPERLRERFGATRQVVGGSRRLHFAAGLPAGPPEPLAQIANPPTDKNLSEHKSPPLPKLSTRPKRPPPGNAPRVAKPVSPTEPVKPARPVPAKSAKASKPVGVPSPAKARKPPKPPRPSKPKPGAPRTFGVGPNPARRERIPNLSLAGAPRNQHSPSRAAGPSAQRNLVCSIFGSRNGRFADFYALAAGAGGRQWIVRRSPWFEWLAGEPPAEAYEAHDILVDELLRDGWRLVGVEGAWYRQRFERPSFDVQSGD